MELQEYLKIWRRSWVLIIALILVTTSASAVWTLRQTPIYKSTSQLYVSVDSGGVSLDSAEKFTSAVRKAVNSYQEIIGSPIVMDVVSEELGGKLSPSQLEARVSASSSDNNFLMDVSAKDADPELAAQIANITSRVFANVVTNQLERSSGAASARLQVSVVRPAQVPSAPISPNPKRNLGFGFMLGLVIGLGGSVLQTVLDTRIRSREDVADITSDPVLGRIAFDPTARTHPLLVYDDPTSARAEAFRLFRTNLQYLRVEGSPHSFVITSAGPTEGKSTAAANLAIAIAQAGSTVCLVDGDLRRPSISHLMGIEGGIGVTDVLIGRASLVDVLQEWGLANLTVLPAGHRPPNPSELLGSQEMEELLGWLKAQFDYVIIDAPPILSVTDPALLAKEVGGALVVVAVGKTQKDGLRDALETMSTIDAHVLGIVLTMVPTKGPHSYSYYQYDYGSEQSRGGGPQAQRGRHREKNSAPARPVQQVVSSILNREAA